MRYSSTVVQKRATISQGKNYEPKFADFRGLLPKQILFASKNPVKKKTAFAKNISQKNEFE
jgi:hypothetical protein